MNSFVPKIGFDRFIRLDWATVALRVRAGVSTHGDLAELLDSSHSGPAARKRTRTVLNRLWLEPHPDLVEFADRGVQIYRETPDTSIFVLTWGMALATYPFFGKVAEIVGRLTAMQGDCTSAEIHRRMAEIYGEREGTLRMTNMVLQSQANWGAIERVERGKRIVRRKTVDLHGESVATWLAEACLRYAGRALPVASIGSSPIIYPFALNNSTPYVLPISQVIEMRIDGSGNRVLDLSKRQCWQTNNIA